MTLLVPLGRQLGREHGFRSSLYSMRTLPGNVCRLDGTPAYGSWIGIVLGVLNKQTEEFGGFNKEWYLST